MITNLFQYNSLGPNLEDFDHQGRWGLMALVTEFVVFRNAGYHRHIHLFHPVAVVVAVVAIVNQV